MNAVYIEITNACNLKCSFCPCSANEFKKYMDIKLFERCITQAKTVADNVYFHVLGEPTLHPEFKDFINQLETVQLKLNLTTNGTTIDKVSKILLDANALRQINFSTHAYSELPKKLAKNYLKKVLDFCKLSSLMRPDLYINLRLWNVGDTTANAWNLYMLEQINSTFNANVELGHFCSRHKSFNVTQKIYLHQDSRFVWPEISYENQSKNKCENALPVKGTCRALDTHVAILCNGSVVACCLDYKAKTELGNINDTSLSQILKSDTVRYMKDGFLANELRHKLCKACLFCKRFSK